MLPVDKFFYQVHAIDSDHRSVQFLGCAFPITPDGGFLTCRHVVNPANLGCGHRVAILDGSEFRPIDSATIRFPKNDNIDIAFVPCGALGGPKREFFPIIPPAKVSAGLDVYSFGYFAVGGGVSTPIESGYFHGRIVSETTTAPGQVKGLTLPFPILEGMSGSPVLHYCNGVKLIGLAFGNRGMRIVRQEVIEYQDTEKEYKESINRIVEFGLAYHTQAIVDSMKEMGAEGTPITTERKKEIPFIE